MGRDTHTTAWGKKKKASDLSVEHPKIFTVLRQTVHLDTDLLAKVIVELKVSWGKEGRTTVQRKRQ